MTPTSTAHYVDTAQPEPGAVTYHDYHRRRAAEESEPGRCPDCAGPSATYRGHVHKWRCAGCVEVAIGLDGPRRPYVPDWARGGKTTPNSIADAKLRSSERTDAP
jgi:hypothetical protein